MNNKKNVLLIFGGCSPEHNISCYCAADFIDSIDYEKLALCQIVLVEPKTNDE